MKQPLERKFLPSGEWNHCRPADGLHSPDSRSIQEENEISTRGGDSMRSYTL